MKFTKYKSVIEYFLSNYKWTGFLIVMFLVVSSIFQVSTIGMILPIIDYIILHPVKDS